MDVKKIIILGTFFLSIVVLSFVFFKSGASEKIVPVSRSNTSEFPLTNPDQDETELVSLFFLSEDDGLLHPEERELNSLLSLHQKARQVIEELIKGSRYGLISPFPQETKVREFFITEEGIAYVDFSRDLQERHPSGATAEITTIYSVVNTLTFNFPKIKKVFIMVDGGERETLGGHIDLSRAFIPKYDLIVN